MLKYGRPLGLIAVMVGLAGASGCAPAGGVTINDPWIKATDTSMTAVFGSLENAGPIDVSLIGASAEFAGVVEIHEVVDGVMREKSVGVVIPGQGSAELEPGADHIMLMGLDRELEAGETVTIELEYSDGSTDAVEVLVKNYAGANEEYDPGHSDTMDMG